MKYYIITKIPDRQGWLATIPERVTIDEIDISVEGNVKFLEIEKIKDGLHVPLGGFCLIVREGDATKVTSRVINELA